MTAALTAAPWLAQYEPGVPARIDPGDEPFPAFLQHAAAAAPAYPALTSANRTVGFAELDALTGRVAAALRRDGVRPGAPVLVSLPNSLPAAAALVGALRAGAVVVPVAPGASAEALLAAAQAARPACAFVAATSAQAVVAALAEGDARVVAVRLTDGLRPAMRWIYRLGAPGRARHEGRVVAPAVPWSSWLAPRAADDEEPPRPGDPALRSFGGDGERTFTHAHLSAAARQARAWLTDAAPGEDTWLVLAPLVSTLGLTHALGAAAALRARVVLVPAGSARDALDALRYLRPAYVVADAAAMIALAADRAVARANAWSVRGWLVGEGLAPEVATRLEESLGVGICHGWSMDAAAGLVACNPLNARRAHASVGLPMPGVEVRAIGRDGAPRPPGERGRLAVRGPNVTGEGWVVTGVDGWLDAAGYVYVAGEQAGGGPYARGA